jgi:catechol-2,3-dioxygenase
MAFEIDSAEFAAARKRLQDMHLAVDVRDFPHMQASALFFNDPEGNHIERIDVPEARFTCHRPREHEQEELTCSGRF